MPEIATFPPATAPTKARRLTRKQEGRAARIAEHPTRRHPSHPAVSPVKKSGRTTEQQRYEAPEAHLFQSDPRGPIFPARTATLSPALHRPGSYNRPSNTSAHGPARSNIAQRDGPSRPGLRPQKAKNPEEESPTAPQGYALGAEVAPQQGIWAPRRRKAKFRPDQPSSHREVAPRRYTRHGHGH